MCCLSLQLFIFIWEDWSIQLLFIYHFLVNYFQGPVIKTNFRQCLAKPLSNFKLSNPDLQALFIVCWYCQGGLQHISNRNRTEWSPIQSVIIRVINKVRWPQSGSLICLITSMITDQIGWHEVPLPVNHNFNKICDI